MEVISKIILGTIQGITEILPVSSSGHLILFSSLFNIEIDLAFLTFLHFTTAFAILLGFWAEIKNFLFTKILLIGIIPAGIMGLFFHGYVEKILHNTTVVITSLLLVGILMILVDNFLCQKEKIKKLEQIKTKSALFIGLFQILALIPGVSRSGITITSAIINGFDKKTAIAFSFLIGLPLIIFSFLLEIYKNPSQTQDLLKQENLIGGLAAFIFAYFTILVFKKLSNTKFLTIFGIYRIVLAITMSIILIT